jgi:hypothetical protein
MSEGRNRIMEKETNKEGRVKEKEQECSVVKRRSITSWSKHHQPSVFCMICNSRYQ